MKYFAIVCAARTGSTFLRDWLNDQAEVACHGEVLAPRFIRGPSTKLLPAPRNAFLPRRNAPMRIPRAEIMESLVYNPDSYAANLKAIGIKVLYDHLLSLESTLEIDWLCRRSDIDIIHLVRRNSRARYVSYLKHLNRIADASEVTDDEVEQDIRRIALAERKVREMLGLDRKWFEIVYEDILRQPDAEAQRLYDFLELTGTPTPFEISIN